MYSVIQFNPELKDFKKSFIDTDSTDGEGAKISIYVPRVSAEVAYSHRKFLLIRLIKNAETLIRRDYGLDKSNQLFSQLWKYNPIDELDKSHHAMAIYHCKEMTRIIFLPIDVPALSIVSKSFHIKPLLSWLQQAQPFYLINLAKKRIYLYKGDPYELKCLKVFESPEQEPNERKKISRETENKKVRAFYIQAEKKIFKTISQDRHPVLLAGVSYLQSIYRQVNRDPDVVLQSIEGNIERWGEAELRNAAFEIMLKMQQHSKKSLIDEYQQNEWSGLATDNLTQIAHAAAQGKIKKLLVANDKLVWGIFNSRNGKLTIHPEQLNSFDEDILDDIAETVLSKGGKVVCMNSHELPTPNPIAALL